MNDINQNSASEVSEYESSNEVEDTIREDLIEMLAKRICWLDSRQTLTDENLQAFVEEASEKGMDFSKLSRLYNLTSKGFKQIFNDVQDEIDNEGGKAWGTWTWSLLSKIKNGSLKSDQQNLANNQEDGDRQMLPPPPHSISQQPGFILQEAIQQSESFVNQMQMPTPNRTYQQNSFIAENQSESQENQNHLPQMFIPGMINVKRSHRPVMTDRQKQFCQPVQDTQKLMLESELREKHMEVQQLNKLLNRQIEAAMQLQRENDQLKTLLSEARRETRETQELCETQRKTTEGYRKRLDELEAAKQMQEMLESFKQSMKDWQRGPVCYEKDQNTESHEQSDPCQSADQLVNSLAKQSVKGTVKVEQEFGVHGKPVLKKTSISEGKKSRSTYNWTTEASEPSDTECGKPRAHRRPTVIFTSPPAIDRIKSKQDDIQAWFKRFEKVVKPQNWDNRTMAAQAATYFEEEAECVWEALDQCDQEDYMVMKAHMLKHFKMPGGESRFMTEYYTAQQQHGESPASFAARLRNLVEKLPSIMSTLSETKMARHFIGRLHSSTAQTLIVNQFRSLEEAVRAAEKVQALTKRTQNEQIQFETVNAVSANNQSIRRPKRDWQKCYGCGGSDHLVYECDKIDRSKTCTHCGWKGHEIESCTMLQKAQKRLLNCSTSVTETKGSDGKSPARKINYDQE